jgi:uncharacterized protein YndB with AHSA1/START domain
MGEKTIERAEGERERERSVERETVLEAEPERVWEALTTDALLADWFADGATVDPVEGGEVAFECEDGERRGTVQRVDPERELAFTWARPGEGESLVTFSLEPVELGTRLVVVERALTGPVALAGVSLAAGSTWRARLRRLDLCLGALVLA